MAVEYILAQDNNKFILFNRSIPYLCTDIDEVVQSGISKADLTEDKAKLFQSIYKYLLEHQIFYFIDRKEVTFGGRIVYTHAVSVKGNKSYSVDIQSMRIDESSI
jgi:hypothetical protein